MADQDETFVRRSVPFSLGSALYTCKDYILLVDRSATTERYRRLYFKDIQSIQVLVTRRRMWMVFLWGFLTASLGLLATSLFFAIDDGTGIGFGVFLGMLALIFATLFILNFVSGKTCRVYVSTAVQRVILPSIERLPRAQRLVAELGQMIADAQGEMTKDELKSELAQGWEKLRSRKHKKGGGQLNKEEMLTEDSISTGGGEVDPSEDAEVEHVESSVADDEPQIPHQDINNDSALSEISELEGEPDVPVS